MINYRINENSAYVLFDDENLDPTECWEFLESEKIENVEDYNFVEYDLTVAQHFGQKNAAIFHK